MKFVSARLRKCGLGNKLFMMAACYGYAQKYGLQPVIHTTSCEVGPHSSEKYEDTVFRIFERTDSTPDYFISEKPEHCLTYNEFLSPPAASHHVQLVGYFQNERYMGKNAGDYISKLKIPRVPLIKDTCFIHVRRLNYHSSKRHGVPLESYYQRAIERVLTLRGAVKFILLSDDLDWCKEQALFRRDDLEFFGDRDEKNALACMRQCEIGGICANSSFSWWGAYLNKHDQKGQSIFIMPRRWVNDPMETDIAFSGALVLDV
jgi:hypothetical protein